MVVTLSLFISTPEPELDIADLTFNKSFLGSLAVKEPRKDLILRREGRYDHVVIVAAIVGSCQLGNRCS